MKRLLMAVLLVLITGSVIAGGGKNRERHEERHQGEEGQGEVHQEVGP